MKKILASVLATAVLLTSGVALAAVPTVDDIKFDGDLKLHYRWNSGDSESGKFWLRINANAPVSKNVDVFARVALQGVSGDGSSADFDSTYYDGTSVASLDRFGLVVKNGGFNYTLGRQGVVIANGLFFDSTGYMGAGKDGFTTSALEGLVVSGKTGATTLQLVAGQAWTAYQEDPKVYALSASYNPAKNWTLSGTLARVNNINSTTEDTNFWAAGAAYSLDKITLTADYGKSNDDVDNTAYAVGAFYALDKKNTVYAIYNKVEANADMGTWITAYDDGGKGMYYGIDHVVSKDTTFGIFYKDMEAVNGGGKYDSFRMTMTYKF